MNENCEFCGGKGTPTTKQIRKSNKTGLEWKVIGTVPAMRCDECMVLWT